HGCEGFPPGWVREHTRVRRKHSGGRETLAPVGGKPSPPVGGKPSPPVGGKPSSPVGGKPSARVAGQRVARGRWSTPRMVSRSRQCGSPARCRPGNRRTNEPIA